MYACRGGTLASRARGGVLTWGGGGGEGGVDDSVAGGKEPRLLDFPVFDGVEVDGGLVGIHFVIPLRRRCVNILGDGINLVIKFSKLRGSLHSWCVAVSVFCFRDNQRGRHGESEEQGAGQGFEGRGHNGTERERNGV